MRTPHNDGLTPPDTAAAPVGVHGDAAAGDARPSPRPQSLRTQSLRAQRAAAASHARRCVLTGATDRPERLVRLALGPDGVVLPDVLAKAPGRGAWIAVDRAMLDTAIAKGRLLAALRRAFRTQAVTIPGDLAERIAAGLARAALARLGLEARAGHVLTGTERIEAAARAGRVALLLHAADARPDGRRRLAQAWRVGSGEEGSGAQGRTLPVDRDALSVAMGRENAVHVAVVDQAAAGRVSAILDRWQAYLVGEQADAPDRAPTGADAMTDHADGPGPDECTDAFAAATPATARDDDDARGFGSSE